MASTFKEFLHEFAVKHRAEAEAAKDTIDEWRAAIEELFGRMRAWLKESDPEGVIEIAEGKEDVKEPSLGRYRVPRLDLDVFGKWIGIIPKARNTVGRAKPPMKSTPERAQGRVDITDELQRYVLYRLRDGDRNEWVIDSAGAEQELLDKEAFERALMSYLR